MLTTEDMLRRRIADLEEACREALAALAHVRGSMSPRSLQSARDWLSETLAGNKYADAVAGIYRSATRDPDGPLKNP